MRNPVTPFLVIIVALTACTAAEPPADPDTSDPQLPPETAEAVDAWIAEGHYLNWTCEPSPHEPRDPSPHGRNRICSNDVLASGASAPWAVGSASVKEILDAQDAIAGYAVYRKLSEGAAPTDGSNWYWYEITDADGVVADGRGGTGAPLTICVGCHSHAGDDNNAMDFVFTKLGG